MPKQVISTDKAPAAIGPYSQAASTGDLIFLSGQLPLLPETGKLLEGTVAQRTEQVIKNIKAIAEAAGASLDDVIKTTVFLADMADFQEFNTEYAKHFTEPYPARSTVQVAALPLGSNIEIEVIINVK